MQEICSVFFKKQKTLTEDVIEDYNSNLCKNSLNCVDSIEIITYKLTDDVRETRHKNKGQKEV